MSSFDDSFVEGLIAESSALDERVHAVGDDLAALISRYEAAGAVPLAELVRLYEQLTGRTLPRAQGPAQPQTEPAGPGPQVGIETCDGGIIWFPIAGGEGR